MNYDSANCMRKTIRNMQLHMIQHIWWIVTWICQCRQNFRNMLTLPEESWVVRFLLLTSFLVIRQNFCFVQLWQNTSKNLQKKTDRLKAIYFPTYLTFKNKQAYYYTYAPHPLMILKPTYKFSSNMHQCRSTIGYPIYIFLHSVISLFVKANTNHSIVRYDRK
jgi:hypothetical protein